MADTMTKVAEEVIEKNGAGDENVATSSTEELKSKLKEAAAEVVNGNGKAHENGNGKHEGNGKHDGECEVINGNGKATTKEFDPAEDGVVDDDVEDDDEDVEDDEECDDDDDDVSEHGEKRGVDDECSTSKDAVESGSSAESAEPAPKQLHQE